MNETFIVSEMEAVNFQPADHDVGIFGAYETYRCEGEVIVDDVYFSATPMTIYTNEILNHWVYGFQPMYHEDAEIELLEVKRLNCRQYKILFRIETVKEFGGDDNDE